MCGGLREEGLLGPGVKGQPGDYNLAIRSRCLLDSTTKSLLYPVGMERCLVRRCLEVMQISGVNHPLRTRFIQAQLWVGTARSCHSFSTEAGFPLLHGEEPPCMPLLWRLGNFYSASYDFFLLCLVINSFGNLSGSLGKSFHLILETILLPRS